MLKFTIPSALMNKFLNKKTRIKILQIKILQSDRKKCKYVFKIQKMLV